MRHARRRHGEHAAEVQGQSREDARGSRDSVRPVLVSAVPHLREDKAGWSHPEVGGRHLPVRDAAGAVAGRVQLLHQPDPVRFLQQEVPQGLRGYHQE